MGRPKLLLEVVKNFFSKPATIQYPREKTEIEPDARGRHYVDITKCVGCSLCMVECPANAIRMEKIPDELAEKAKRNPRKLFPVINYLKCIYCYRCVAVCPTQAYVVSNEYRLATQREIDSRELSLEAARRGGGS